MSLVEQEFETGSHGNHPRVIASHLASFTSSNPVQHPEITQGTDLWQAAPLILIVHNCSYELLPSSRHWSSLFLKSSDRGFSICYAMIPSQAPILSVLALSLQHAWAQQLKDGLPAFMSYPGISKTCESALNTTVGCPAFLHRASSR